MNKSKLITEKDVKRIEKAIDKKPKKEKGDDLFIERVKKVVNKNKPKKKK
nr:hypothetical protein [uncultured Psychroserpens sp.]